MSSDRARICSWSVPLGLSLLEVSGSELPIDKGLTVKEMQRSIRLDDYKNWDMYDAWFELNVKGMYRQLTAR